MIEKRNAWRNRQHLNNVAKLPCVRCGADNGTIVAAHYCGDLQYLLGKGAGIKATDAATAALCHDCHVTMDQFKDGNTTERSEEFLYLIVKTYELLFKKELLGVVK